MLRELNKEEAALANGMPDAIRRVETLVKRANRLDPHYRFKITSDGTTTSVAIFPAYAGAEVDRPITVKGEFRFNTKTKLGRAKQEEFERALDFGTPAELSGDFVPEMSVDAPAGLGGTYKAPTITIGPGKPVRTEPLDLVFSIVSPDNEPVAALTLHCIPQTSGRRGTVLRGSDRGQYVDAEVTIDVSGRRFHINLTARWASFVPHDFVPVARFLAAYHSPNRVVVAQTDGTGASEPLDCGPSLEMPEWLVQFVTDLAVIQASAGIVREVGEITQQDLTNVTGGAALLRGLELPVPWTSGAVTVRTSASRATRVQIAENTMRLERVVDSPFELNVCGTLYPIGRRYSTRTAVRVDPSDVEALVAGELSEDLRVTLLPDPNEPFANIRLVE